jgi:phenylacetate-CoA ligase
VTIAKGELVGRYLREYEAFQWLDRERIAAIQLERLRSILGFAGAHVPLYRDAFRAAGFEVGDLRSLEDVGKLPTIEKEDLRDSGDRLIPQDRRRRAARKTTGGSTGQAVTVLKNTEALARERAATWRAYRWAGVGVGDPQARFWGVPLASTDRITARIVDFIANRKRLSAFGIDEEILEDYYRRVQRFRPTYFYGYVSVIAQFARFMKDRGYAPPPSLKSVITTSEVLDEGNRREIESAIKRRVFNEYGCGEVGSIAHECEEGTLHLMEDNLLVEVVPSESDASGAGEIVVTDLHNRAMPLIRYRLKDFATPSGAKCGCGRGLAAIARVHGRAYDLIRGNDGRIHHPELVMYVFEDLKRRGLGVRQFQVVQNRSGGLEVYLVSPTGSPEETERLIRHALAARLGESLSITFAYRDAIPRERSGKIRLVKSEMGNARGPGEPTRGR